MFTRLRRLLYRAGSKAVVCRVAPNSAAFAEALERRSLLSAAPVSAAKEGDVTGPTVVKEQLLGSDPRGATGVVITFSEALDEATAEDLENFRVGVRTDRKQSF